MTVNNQYEKGVPRTSNGQARLEQVTLNKQVLGYLATLGPKQIDSNRIPEILNQAVGLMEIVMGDQTAEDYPRLIYHYKNAGIMTETIARGLMESMNADEALVEMFFKAWDDL